MDRIIQQAGERTPLVDFDFPNSKLLVEGESYPEDAAAFFGPLLEVLKIYLDHLGRDQVVFDIKLAYFNSSSAKALMNMFQLLEKAAEKGSRVIINWLYQPDDDTMAEFGEDFSEDFQAARFNLKPIKE
ncbi:MAG: DUF1987 domain-containing protein [Pseudomonadota bacterium]